MAGAKDGGGGKEKKGNKEGGGGGESAALLRRLADEVAALRADVDTVRRAGGGNAAAPSSPASVPRPKFSTTGASDAVTNALTSELQGRLNGDRDAAVVIGYAYRAPEPDTGDTVGFHDMNVSGGLAGLLETPDVQVAQLGQAFSSTPKVAILRALLWEGAQSAALLGERAGLTTGSLYHHLRELTHAEVIVASGRNRFALTNLGRQTALVLFTLAGGRKAS
jgi:hypothetical protein